MGKRASGRTIRAKGHSLEREVAKMFREELDFKYAKTSRLASRLLDNCQVDISGIPYLVQTKMGYAKSRPKPDVIFQEMEDLLKENFPPEDIVHSYPKILVHKLNGKKKGYNSFVTMSYDDFRSLLLKIKNTEKL